MYLSDGGTGYEEWIMNLFMILRRSNPLPMKYKTGYQIS